MPVTLPAHAAAILPIHRMAPRIFPASALVVGSCAPDLAYALGVFGTTAHTLKGLFIFCLPIGLVAYAWAEALLLPVLARSLPTWRGIQWARFAVTRGLPSSPRGWIAAASAVLLGALTHILWDGLTHRLRWPARELYGDVRIQLGFMDMPLPNFLQLASSVVGTAIVLGYLARQYPRLAPAEGGTPGQLASLLAPTLASAVLGLWWRLTHPLGVTLHSHVWFTFWTVTGWSLVGLTVACLLSQVCERARSAPRRLNGASPPGGPLGSALPVDRTGVLPPR